MLIWPVVRARRHNNGFAGGRIGWTYCSQAERVCSRRRVRVCTCVSEKHSRYANGLLIYSGPVDPDTVKGFILMTVDVLQYVVLLYLNIIFKL